MIDDEVLCAATGCATNATTVPVATSIAAELLPRVLFC